MAPQDPAEDDKAGREEIESDLEAIQEKLRRMKAQLAAREAVASVELEQSEADKDDS